MKQIGKNISKKMRVCKKIRNFLILFTKSFNLIWFNAYRKFIHRPNHLIKLLDE